MNEKPGRGELRAEVEGGNFERATSLAACLELPEEEVQDLRLKALWQMSALYRNALGTKRLAQEYGVDKEELREFMEKSAEQKGREGNSKPLGPCYDLSTGRYLSFEEWMDNFLKNWDKLAVS